MCQLRGAFIKIPNFFVQAFRIDVDTWKFSMLFPYILWDDRPIFLISGPKEQLQQELEYILLKPNCHSWWQKCHMDVRTLKKNDMQQNAVLNLEKKATETYGML